MNWVEERDQLIADTLAFVKEVSGDQPELVEKLTAAVKAEVVAAENPNRIVPEPPQPMKLADLREDIRNRVASFKARQQDMQDKREADYQEVIAKVRASLEHRS
jgi:Skp family chaperone for outer membrane proteins